MISVWYDASGCAQIPEKEAAWNTEVQLSWVCERCGVETQTGISPPVTAELRRGGVWHERDERGVHLEELAVQFLLGIEAHLMSCTKETK